MSTEQEVIEPTANKMDCQVALFRYVEGGWLTVWSKPRDSSDYTPAGYVRVSEWQRIEFKPLTDDEQIQGAIAGLQKQRAEISRDFADKLSKVDALISNLRAITHQVPA